MKWTVAYPEFYKWKTQNALGHLAILGLYFRHILEKDKFGKVGGGGPCLCLPSSTLEPPLMVAGKLYWASVSKSRLFVSVVISNYFIIKPLLCKDYSKLFWTTSIVSDERCGVWFNNQNSWNIWYKIIDNKSKYHCFHGVIILTALMSLQDSSYSDKKS